VHERAQAWLGLVRARAGLLLAEKGIDDRRLKMAAICSVCAESFTRQIREFSATLATLEAA
jgi:F420-non-reducing hydrogenase iron-sulfur subunit